MTTTAPTPQAESIIRNWISTSLHDRLTDVQFAGMPLLIL